MKKKETNNLFMWILFVIIIILVFLLPRIYIFIENSKLPQIGSIKDNKSKENVEVDDELLEELHYPIMRNSIYNSNTYYSLDKFKISDMSNSDILLTAFMDMYEGNMTSYGNTGKCTNISKQFDDNYLKLRIKNILGRDINYNFENFDVPEDSTSSYTGTWIYDASNSRFTYNGLCNSKKNGIKYYDLKQFIKAEYSNKDILVYYYVGFAKLEGNSYIIYSDSSMTNEISNGTFESLEKLSSAFNNLNNNDKKIYKYTFKNNLCSYNEYCLYEGEWTNEV